MAAVEGDCAAEEASRGQRTFIVEDFDVGEPRVVVDSDVDELPAGDAALAARDPGLGLARPAAADAVADTAHSAELLDVDVHELARAR